MSDKPDNDRIIFHANKQVMEVDFSNMLLDSAAQVNSFYDLVDQKIAASGQNKWYFLVNYKNCRLSPGAWIPFSNRGKKVNIACSLGSARFAISDEIGKSILKQSEKEHFDPNLFTTRQAAIDYLMEMRQAARKTEAEAKAETSQAAVPNKQEKTILRSINERIKFIDDLTILDVDFSDYVFDSIAAVNDFYDAVTAKIDETDQNWFFLVNYTGTKIFPDAWYQWAIRSRRLNTARSLGTVRFNPDEAARKEIMKRAEADESDPNLVATRDEALIRLIKMRAESNS